MTNKVIDYKLASLNYYNSNHSLKEVIELLKDGYILYGNPFHTSGGSYQAMIKIEEKENNN